MKRDMELVREILLAIESSPTTRVNITIKVKDFSSKEVSYHVMLLAKANLIEARDTSTLQEFRWHPIRLTWEGHEFLDATRDDKVWKKVKGEIAEKGGSFTLDIMKGLASQFLREQFGLG